MTVRIIDDVMILLSPEKYHLWYDPLTLSYDDHVVFILLIMMVLRKLQFWSMALLPG